MARYSVVLLVLALALGCQHRVRDPRQQPSAPHADPNACGAICSHLRDLKCPNGEPTPGGRTCEDICRHGLESHLVNLDETCMRTLARCDDEPACSRQP